VPGIDAPLRAVVGEKTAKALAKALDLHTLGDLLRHYPRRYTERGELTNIASLAVGEEVTVSAQVRRVNLRRMRNRPGNLLEVVVGDATSTLTLTFFNQHWRQRELVVGRWGLFAGKVGEFKGDRQLSHPQYQLVAEPGDETAGEALEEFVGGLIPVYPAAKDLPTWVIGRCVKVALTTVAEPEDPLPEALRGQRGLVPLPQALHDIHRPESWDALGAARKRLKWDEAMALQVTLAQRRAAAAQRPGTPRAARAGGLLAAFDSALPFALTDGQREVGEVLAAELAQAHPMHRLLQGEVGSGKTVVALRAMLQVVDAGGQAALLAPTEVLAGQHARSLRQLLGPLGHGGELDAAEEATRIALLTGSLSAPARRAALDEAASGAAGIIVGTHALLSEGVEFAELGLVVVDEQHRFGVEQRDALRAKAGERPPHVLVMTATPIPRTVAMTVFGDLETSSLTELPAGRSPIASHLVPAADKPHFLDRTWQRIREEVAAGHQAYVVCPRIGEETAADEDTDLSEPDDGEAKRRAPIAVLDVAPMLAEGPLAGLRVGTLHGRLPSDAKDAVMRQFAAGELDVLIATTVVEVGVDVPNATAMVILDADRFGVSQLHQLRGRVGRGSAAGLCLLVTDAPPGSPARQRLESVAATTDGFALARLDLEQRREGDVLGAAQSGRRSQLKLLSLLRDEDVITAAREEAIALVAEDPMLAKHPALAAAAAALVDEERADYLEKG
jgi:ATP-dependent DNA helicase RecG